MTLFEVLYGITTLSWSELHETLIIGSELIQETTEMVRKIQEHIKASQSWKKSYADRRRRPLVFGIGDQVFLSGISWKYHQSRMWGDSMSGNSWVLGILGLLKSLKS